MGCCNNNNKNNNNTNATPRDDPEGIDGLPYVDPWMVTAQMLSIVAVLMSWIWWPCFAVSFSSMILLQIAWWCRLGRGILLTSAVVALLAACFQIGMGVYLIMTWTEFDECGVFGLNTWKLDDDYILENYDPVDNCHEEKWATVSFVCAVFWVGSASCILWFVLGGRHARWEKKHSRPERAKIEMNNVPYISSNTTTNNNDVVVELGAIPVATVVTEPAAVVVVTDNDKVNEVYGIVKPRH